MNSPEKISPEKISPERIGEENSAEKLPAAGRVGSLCIRVTIHEGVSATIVLLGRLDAVEAPTLRQQFAGIFDAGAVTVVVDLVGVTFIDSAGLAALVRARRDAQSAGGDLVLIRPADEAALRVFRLTQFDEVFQMVASRGAA
ncbi:MAG TPA: STAS domain-containing protein [Nakamurella sp.]|nr:STAS domain-containing protein [Nakamurella sp.]